MSKVKEKLKKVGTATKNFAKKSPKTVGAIVALAVVAGGGEASGLVQVTEILTYAQEIVKIFGS